jgi:hypothetical protein
LGDTNILLPVLLVGVPCAVCPPAAAAPCCALPLLPLLWKDEDEPLAIAAAVLLLLLPLLAAPVGVAAPLDDVFRLLWLGSLR